jgi:hypothetical protein
MPSDAYSPLLLALALAALFIGALLHSWWLLAAALVVITLASIAWLWPQRSLSQIET